MSNSSSTRYGVDITDVYDVIDVLGQGHMVSSLSYDATIHP